MHTGSTSVLAVAFAAAMASAPVPAALAQGSKTSGTSQGSQTSSTTQTRQPAGQRQATPGRLVVPVTGTIAGAETEAPEVANAASAASAATGTFAIQRFARTTDDAVAAVGTLTLTFADQSSDSTRTIITQAAMPLARSPEGATPAPAATGTTSTSTSPSTPACEAARLVLDTITIAPLGVAVDIERANVDITVLPGTGERLASLLCELTSQINGPQAPAELVNSLNALLDMLG